MSSCSRQYASRHISGLKRAYETTSFANSCSPRIHQQQPLLFLYPSWFRQCWHHQYHTDRATGQDRQPIRKDNAKELWGPQEQKALRTTLERKKQPKYSPLKRPFAQKIDDAVKPSLVKQPKPADPAKSHYRRVVNSQKVYSVLSAELDNIPPAPEHNLVFTISQAHARRLVGHEHADSWVHHQDTGCVVRIVPGPDAGQCTVSLDGSERACELAKKSMELVEEDETVPAWERAISKVSSRTDVSDVICPPEWSVRTLNRYIDALLRLRRHHGMDRIRPAEERHHNLKIAARLADLFHQPETALFASSTSFEKALKFCREHTELSPYASEILTAAQNMGVPLTVTAYNGELTRNLIIKNSTGVDDVIRMMRDNHVRPNSDTWVIILQFAENPEMRLLALKRCLDTGKIVDPNQSSKLVQALINSEMVIYLAQSDGVARFMDDMDRLFGKTWLTSKALARMLRICRIRYARVTQASQVLEEVAKRQNMAKIMDRYCFEQLLRIAKKAGNLKDALDVVISQIDHTDPALYQVVLEPLFELAWLKKSLTVCRLLWLFACTSGQASFRMKNIIWHSVQGNFAQSLDIETRNWQIFAGALILSQPKDVDRIRKALPRLFANDTTTSILRKMTEPTFHASVRHEQLQLAQILIERDTQAWRFYHSIPLAKVRSFLLECYEYDDSLRTGGLWKMRLDSAALDACLTSVQNVRLKPRDKPLQYRQEDKENPHRGAFMFNDIPLDYHTLEIKVDAAMAHQKAEISPYSDRPDSDAQQSLFPLSSEVIDGLNQPDEINRRATPGNQIFDEEHVSDEETTPSLPSWAFPDATSESTKRLASKSYPRSIDDHDDSPADDETSQISLGASV